jgi:hypothetical protein
MTNTHRPVPRALASILDHITATASDRNFFGSITVKFQGPYRAVYVVTNRGCKPEELKGGTN